jgi:hypothetical protein
LKKAVNLTVTLTTVARFGSLKYSLQQFIYNKNNKIIIFKIFLQYLAFMYRKKEAR